jgi:hypothetical protein
MKEMSTATALAEAFIKLVVASVFYCVLVWVVAKAPTAGGMMLTFPALNGLTLAAAPAPEHVRKAVRTMLLMPILNGLLCVIFIFSFLWLKTSSSALPMLIALGLIWCAIAGTIIAKGIGIGGTANQLTYIGVASLSLIAWLIILLVYAPQEISRISVEKTVWQILFEDNLSKITLFTLAMFVVLGFSDFGSKVIQGEYLPRILGVAGGFPLVPLFGLFSLAGSQDRALDERLNAFGDFALGVWIGPIIAFLFITSFSATLQRIPLYSSPRYWVARFVLVMPYWAICLGIIAACTVAIGAIRR